MNDCWCMVSCKGTVLSTLFALACLPLVLQSCLENFDSTQGLAVTETGAKLIKFLHATCGDHNEQLQIPNYAYHFAGSMYPNFPKLQ